MTIILAIDGGGSRTRCLAIDQEGCVVGEAVAGPSNHLLVDLPVVRESLVGVINAALENAKLKLGDVTCLSAGLAGVDFDGTGASEMESMIGELGFDRVVINGDMVIAHAGALGSRAGVVTLSGTGSVTLGIGDDGTRVKVGGWGPVYGDEGSAYGIGQMALRAAARAFDCRGPATTLTRRILSRFKLKDFKETIRRVYVEEMETREIAALSRLVYEAAEDGDEVARNIFLQAGDEVAESVKAAIKQLNFATQKILVSYQGAMLKSCSPLLDRFIQKLTIDMPTVDVVAPRFEPVIGAYLLGCQELDWQLDENMLEKLEVGTGRTITERS